MNDLLICRSSKGETVAEVDLGETRLTATQIVDQARGLGAELLWAHGSTPGLDGFVSKPDTRTCTPSSRRRATRSLWWSQTSTPR
jgi:hypothetical protein